MTDSPYDAADGGSSETSDKPKVLAQEGGSSSGRLAHKTSAFRNLFKRSPSNREGVTPRSGGVSGRATGTNQASVSEAEEDFNDHMAGSIHSPTDICKECGFPRRSSVCCPVTRRHHGTDELMSSARVHSRSSSGAMNIMARIRGKLQLSPGQKASPHDADDANAHTPQNGDLPPLTLTAHAGPYDDAEYAVSGAKEMPLLRNATMSPLRPPNDGENGVSADNAEANLDAYGPGDSTAEAPQYYCYTDENGETVYYQPEPQDASGHDATQAPRNASRMDSAAAADPAAVVPEGLYVYQYVDENGETVNCLVTPQADEGEVAAAAAAGDEEEGEEAAAADRATPTTSAAAHAGSDTANSSEVEELATTKKKGPSTFFAAIQNVFRPRKDSKPKESQHEDPVNMAGTDDSAPSPSSEANVEGAVRNESGETPQGCLETHAHDAEVATFLEQLDASEKKKFLKERKSLIKDLASSERKERETIVKGRSDGMAAFTRDKLSAAFSIRKDERVIKTGQKKGEPL